MLLLFIKIILIPYSFLKGFFCSRVTHSVSYTRIQFLTSLDKCNCSVGSPCRHVKPSQRCLLAALTAPFDGCIVRSSASLSAFKHLFKGAVPAVPSWKRHSSELLQRLLESVVTVRKATQLPDVSCVERECWMSKAAAELVSILSIFDLRSIN